MTTLSLETSKLIYDLVGEYETETKHGWRLGAWRPFSQDETKLGFVRQTKNIPAPTFAELIRVLPKIGEKLGLDNTPYKMPNELTLKFSTLWFIYMNAPTEPEGMQAVESYFLTLLK